MSAVFSISPYHSVVLHTHIPIPYIKFNDSFRKQKSAKHWLLSGLLDRLVTYISSRVDPLFPYGIMWCYMASSLIAVYRDSHGIFFLFVVRALISIR